MNYDCIVIHYSEIGLKGDNRRFFENALIRNIHERTGLKVSLEYGRLVSNYDDKGFDLLSKIPGVHNYSRAVKTKLDINDFKAKSVSMISSGTFRVSAQRSNKQFKLTSPEINREVGDVLCSKGLKVKLDNPDTELFIEVGEKSAFIYTEKLRGIGGLPVGVTGKLVALLSGGIDSPVACFEMIKRGCRVIPVHFFNKREGVKDKIRDLAKVLSEYQGPTKLYIVPFLDVQKEVIMKVPATHRMIVYRRFMIRIAAEVLKKEKALGFVTGDNVAQVASQTLENLSVIWQAADKNVYAPLISRDKEDTINQAKKIGTYDISIKPYSDCCSYLIATHPETKSKLSDVLKFEQGLDAEKLVSNAFSNAIIETVTV